MWGESQMEHGSLQPQTHRHKSWEKAGLLWRTFLPMVTWLGQLGLLATGHKLESPKWGASSEKLS